VASLKCEFYMLGKIVSGFWMFEFEINKRVSSLQCEFYTAQKYSLESLNV
jgi:hypothetical protein